MPYVRHWLRNSLLLFALAIAMGLVAAHTSIIQPHDLKWDQQLENDTRSAALTPLMKLVSDIASPVGGLVILALWCLWLLIRRHQPVKAVSTFLVVGVGWNSSEIAKILVARNRPPIAAVHSLDPEIGSNSFPSGHVAFTVSAVIAACFLARGTRWQWPTMLGGAAAVVLVAFSRLYIGAHYPTDVLGSLLVSSAAIICLCGLWHIWLKDLLPRVPVLAPLLARFGPLEQDLAPSAEPVPAAASTAYRLSSPSPAPTTGRRRHAAH